MYLFLLLIAVRRTDRMIKYENPVKSSSQTVSNYEEDLQDKIFGDMKFLPMIKLVNEDYSKSSVDLEAFRSFFDTTLTVQFGRTKPTARIDLLDCGDSQFESYKIITRPGNINLCPRLSEYNQVKIEKKKGVIT